MAEEVRNLATRAGSAAQEITDTIQTSSQKVRDGSELSRQTAEVLSEIVLIVDQVSELIDHIAHASSEHADGVKQITTGLNDDALRGGVSGAMGGRPGAGWSLALSAGPEVRVSFVVEPRGGTDGRTAPAGSVG